MIQFAHISRPEVFKHLLHCRRLETEHLLAIALGITLEEVLRQQGNVFATVAQWRQVDLDGVEAKEKVGAESSLGALHFQVCVGRRKYTGIYALGFRRANTLHLAGFEHPQEFGLLFDRYIGDFVEKDRAFICQLKASDAIAASVCERALHVSKQFALECTFGQATRIHGHHGP